MHQKYKFYNMKTKLAILFFMISLTFYAQDKYEYMGAVKLNGDSKTIISYRLVFSEKDGIVKGYSVTDLAGPHETKNAISGTYNSKTKEFSFKEEDIIYTKSTISDDMFCFVNFTGKVKLVNENSIMEGNFKGLFKNKQKCIDGTLTLVGSARIYKLVNKVNKKLQKSKKVSENDKKKFNPVNVLDSLKVNSLTRSQNVNVFTDTGAVKLEIWDNGKEDGDVVSLYLDGVVLVRNYKVTNEKKVFTINVKNTSTLRVVAVTEGTVSPNTAVIKIDADDRFIEVYTNLKKDEEASITLVKKK